MKYKGQASINNFIVDMIVKRDWCFHHNVSIQCVHPAGVVWLQLARGCGSRDWEQGVAGDGLAEPGAEAIRAHQLTS